MTAVASSKLLILLGCQKKQKLAHFYGARLISIRASWPLAVAGRRIITPLTLALPSVALELLRATPSRRR